MLPIETAPEYGACVTRRAFAMVDFPEPVRPRTAHVEPPGISNDTLSRTAGRSSAYLNDISWKRTLSHGLGQSWGGSISPLGSSGIRFRASTLSSDTASS